MIAEVSNVSKIKSPYQAHGEELRNELRAFEDIVKSLLMRIEQLWVVENPVKASSLAFKFSQ